MVLVSRLSVCLRVLWGMLCFLVVGRLNGCLNNCVGNCLWYGDRYSYFWFFGMLLVVNLLFG